MIFNILAQKQNYNSFFLVGLNSFSVQLHFSVWVCAHCVHTEDTKEQSIIVEMK